MRIKGCAEDFIVEEILPSGEVAEINTKIKFRQEPKAEHLIVFLEKKNWTTMAAVKEVCKRLRVSQKRAGFAGNKDRRALTCQRISIWNCTPESLSKVQIKDITLTPICYGKRVELGSLKGNRFTITIHDAKGMPKLPSQVLNYFGVQRFGEMRPITHLVGKAIVDEDYKTAVETYLFKWFEAEREGDKGARQRLEKKRDYKEALEYFPRYLKYERILLNHLAEYPNDYVGALRSLPKKLLLLFPHAYQAHLFNKVLDKRKGQLGLEPLEGDICEDGVVTAPLFGCDVELAKGKPGEIEKDVLEDEWLELESFELRSMPELGTKGMRRKSLLVVEGFRVLGGKEENSVTVWFSLPKASYATTVIDQLIWQ